ncbi:hypothetical protein BDY21DRAFT_333939 [Lineolata rhizophorae]|uniref:Uncharacterized protein n=1 Tax=Lineolata rhizophorae TaxID=578093 RepID=A0A6A6PAF6_9PEZI|nr:hypothetical protein BDY21DRAFT_333939 [Lineolata rhizophorae]
MTALTPSKRLVIVLRLVIWGINSKDTAICSGLDSKIRLPRIVESWHVHLSCHSVIISLLKVFCLSLVAFLCQVQPQKLNHLVALRNLFFPALISAGQQNALLATKKRCCCIGCNYHLFLSYSQRDRGFTALDLLLPINCFHNFCGPHWWH